MGAAAALPPRRCRARLDGRAACSGRRVTWSVTPDVVDLVDSASASMPEESIERADLPCPNGFLWLDKPFFLHDDSGTVAIPVRAVHGGSRGRPHFERSATSPARTTGPTRTRCRTRTGRSCRRCVWPTRSTGPSGIRAGGPRTACTRRLASSRRSGRSAHSASPWSRRPGLIERPGGAPKPCPRPGPFMSSRCAASVGRRPRSRRQQRSTGRTGGSSMATGATSTSPSTGLHRQQWIAPYVKGPEDKPLVVRARSTTCGGDPESGATNSPPIRARLKEPGPRGPSAWALSYFGGGPPAAIEPPAGEASESRADRHAPANEVALTPFVAPPVPLGQPDRDRSVL